MCHLFFVLKSYCVTIKGSFQQLLKIKSWSWPENPPLEFLGRVGDVQYIVTHTEIGMFSVSFGFVQPTSNYKGS